MKICFVAGLWSTSQHGPFDMSGLYENRALTGSESTFFNTAWGLAELKHEVHVYCDVQQTTMDCGRLAGCHVHPLEKFAKDGEQFHVYVALNEPDFLREVPEFALRIVLQQQNNFGYAKPGYAEFVDVFVMLSPVHRDEMIRSSGLPIEKCVFIPNSISCDLLPKWSERKPNSLAWISSPDRGLHRLLEIYDELRVEVPDVTLDIYYRFAPWYEQMKDSKTIVGDHARYIGKFLEEHGTLGQQGIVLHDAVNNIELARRLTKTELLPYTCETIAFTEGFSVAILDGCINGAFPIISDVDSIGDIYAGVAHIIPGLPKDNRDSWINSILGCLNNRSLTEERRQAARNFAYLFDRTIVAQLWEEMLFSCMPGGSDHDGIDLSRMPKTMGSYKDFATTHRPTVKTKLRSIDADADTAKIQPRIQVEKTRLDVAVMLGVVSKKIHGQFDVANLYDTLPALTGTGNTLFSLAWGLSELGHKVSVYCDVEKATLGAERLAGADVYPIEQKGILKESKHDAYISINEPDLLRKVPESALRICHYLLNDWTGTEDGHDDFIDLWVLCSQAQRRRLRGLATKQRGPRDTPVLVAPLSFNPEFVRPITDQPFYRKRRGSIVYCSSPDRGMHHLLDIFEDVRKRAPEANLRIFYRYEPWRDAVINLDSIHMRPQQERAKKIEAHLEKSGRNGENGVTMLGAVSNRQIGFELAAAEVMAYPCDPINFTEGFSCSTLESIAAGCHVVISGTDALSEIYGGSANVINGKPMEKREEWINTIVKALQSPDEKLARVRQAGNLFASEHTRAKVSEIWERILSAALFS